MDEAQKLVRRTQINAELNPLRIRRNDNVRARNKLTELLERLRPARRKLNVCISNSLTVARNMERCHQNTSSSNFKGSRRTHLVARLADTSGSIRSERERHQRNLETLDNRINTTRDRREDISATIRNQSNRISSLEAELQRLR